MSGMHSGLSSLRRFASAALALTWLTAAAAADTFTLQSPTLAANGMLSTDQVYSGFGCTGKNISPALSWSGAPSATRSFAVTVYDPDAPTGSGWWHWVVYNIPASVSELPQGAGDASGAQLPKGAVQGKTDFPGSTGFGGACPPPGNKPHRYIFTVFALKTDKIEVPADATAALVGYNLNANSLGKASFTAKYGR